MEPEFEQRRRGPEPYVAICEHLYRMTGLMRDVTKKGNVLLRASSTSAADAGAAVVATEGTDEPRGRK